MRVVLVKKPAPVEQPSPNLNLTAPGNELVDEEDLILKMY